MSARAKPVSHAIPKLEKSTEVKKASFKLQTSRVIKTDKADHKEVESGAAYKYEVNHMTFSTSNIKQLLVRSQAWSTRLDQLRHFVLPIC